MPFHLGSRKVTFPKIQCMCGGISIGMGLPASTVLPVPRASPLTWAKSFFVGHPRDCRVLCSTSGLHPHDAKAPKPGGTAQTVSRHCSCPLGVELYYPACQAASDHAVTAWPSQPVVCHLNEPCLKPRRCLWTANMGPAESATLQEVRNHLPCPGHQEATLSSWELA